MQSQVTDGLFVAFLLGKKVGVCLDMLDSDDGSIGVQGVEIQIPKAPSSLPQESDGNFALRTAWLRSQSAWIAIHSSGEPVVHKLRSLL